MGTVQGSEISTCAVLERKLMRTNGSSKKKKKLSLTLHFILGEGDRSPVWEDIWNRAKSPVHEPGGHGTHWHCCEGKPTLKPWSSYLGFNETCPNLTLVEPNLIDQAFHSPKDMLRIAFQIKFFILDSSSTVLLVISVAITVLASS